VCPVFGDSTLVWFTLIHFDCPAPTHPPLDMELNGHDGRKPSAGFKIEPFKLEVQRCSQDDRMLFPISTEQAAAQCDLRAFTR